MVQPTRLNVVAVDAACLLGGQLAQTALVAAIVVDVFEVEGVDVAGEVAVCHC